MKSVEVEMLAAVNAPEFKDPVTTAGPIIVVFVALTTTELVPEVANSLLVVIRFVALTVEVQYTWFPNNWVSRLSANHAIEPLVSLEKMSPSVPHIAMTCSPDAT